MIPNEEAETSDGASDVLFEHFMSCYNNFLQKNVVLRTSVKNLYLHITFSETTDWQKYVKHFMWTGQFTQLNIAQRFRIWNAPLVLNSDPNCVTVYW